MKYFSYFFQKTCFDISCKLSALETICMKCQNLFCGKSKKNIISLSSAEFVQRQVILNASTSGQMGLFKFQPLTLKAPSKICSRRHSNFFLFFRENKF